MRPIDGDALKKKFANSDPNKDFDVNYFLISIDEMPTLSLSSIPQPPNTKLRSHDASIIPRITRKVASSVLTL